MRRKTRSRQERSCQRDRQTERLTDREIDRESGRSRDRQKAAYVVLGQLDLDGFGVGANGSLGVQCGVSVAQPGLQLGERVLELPQSQQGPLQLVLNNGEKSDHTNVINQPNTA